jgi:ABC-type antimicrobial peptide transport system permease subunit
LSDANALRGAVRATMRDLDPHLPIASIATLGDVLDQSAAPVRQLASGMGAMGVIAMLLAALGLSALLSFIVEQRRFEIGVRIALGARAGTVTRMVLGQSMALTLIGVVVGTLIAAAGALTMEALLFGLPPLDPVAFSASTAFVVIVALLSSIIPARQAARVDPMVTLRAT